MTNQNYINTNYDANGIRKIAANKGGFHTG